MIIQILIELGKICIKKTIKISFKAKNTYQDMVELVSEVTYFLLHFLHAFFVISDKILRIHIAKLHTNNQGLMLA